MTTATLSRPRLSRLRSIGAGLGDTVPAQRPIMLRDLLTYRFDPSRGALDVCDRMLDSPQPPALFNDFWTLAYAAIG